MTAPAESDPTSLPDAWDNGPMDSRDIWREVVVLGRRVKESGLSINAAAIAYNAFLALVPLAFALLGVAAIVGRSATAVDQVEQALDPLVPAAVKDFILGLLVEAADRVGQGGGSVWLVAASVAVALFLGSRAVATLQKSLAYVEDRTERRPPLQMRLVAVALTLGGGLALVVVSLSLVIGSRFVEFLGELAGLTFLDELWAWIRVPVAAGGLYVFLLALYRFGPPQPLPRPHVAALVATAGAVLGSLGFGIYLSITPELGATFGVLGAVAVALVWLYVGALAIVLGGIVVYHFETE